MIPTTTEIWRKLEMTERTLVRHFPGAQLAKDWGGTFRHISRGAGKGLLPLGGIACWFSTSFDSLETRLWYKGFCRKKTSFRTSKSWKLVTEEQWNFKEKIGLEPWDVASFMSYSHLWLVQMTPCTPLQTDACLDMTVCRPEGKAIYTPSYVTVVI